MSQLDIPHAISLVAPIIGSFLAFEDRRACTRVHGCFREAHGSFKYHLWEVAGGKGADFDPATKLASLRRFKPRLSKLDVIVCDTLRDDALATLLSWRTDTTLELFLMSEHAGFLAQLLAAYESDATPRFAALRIKAGTAAAADVVRLSTLQLCSHAQQGGKLELLCRPEVAAALSAQATREQLAQLLAIYINDWGQHHDARPSLAIDPEKMSACREVRLYTGRFVDGPGVAQVATHIDDHNEIYNCPAIVEHLSVIARCTRLATLNFEKMNSSQLLLAGKIGLLTSAVPAATTVTFWGRSLRDMSLRVVVAALRPRKVVFWLDRLRPGPNNDLDSVCGMLTWWRLRETGVRVDVYAHDTKRAVADKDMPPVEELLGRLRLLDAHLCAAFS